MCIIMYQPESEYIPAEAMRNGYLKNQDGMGLMYVDDKQIKIHKQLTDYPSFREKYEEVQSLGCPVVVHFRIGTHGNKTLDNCHPFQVDKNLAFAHNGILDIEIPNGSLDSDTVTFNKEILQRLPSSFLEEPNLYLMVNKFIGTTYNKMVFLDTDSNVYIINGELGYWDEEIWYSNKSYETVKLMPLVNRNIAHEYWSNKKTYIDPLDYNTTPVCDYCNTVLQTEKELEEYLCESCSKDETEKYKQYSTYIGH